MINKGRKCPAVGKAAVMLLFTLNGCNTESVSMVDGQVISQPAPTVLGAATLASQTATLDIVGLRTGIPMTVNADGSVSVTVSAVPAGTWTFRITYFAGTPAVKVLEASGQGTVVANLSSTVSCNTLKSDFDDDQDGATNLLEVNAGFNPLDHQSTPILVTAIAAGGHSLALKSNGTVWTWGGQVIPQPGFPSALNDRPTPVQVVGQGGNGFLTNVIAIAAGGSHSLVLKGDRTVWAWGQDGSGQLGNDAALVLQSTPVQVVGQGGNGFLTNVIAVAAGNMHSLALKGDGTVWAWGSDLRGALGDDAASVNRPTPVQVTGLGDVIAIAAGNSHSLALRRDGTVWAWGGDFAGQLGNDAALSDRPTPVQVVGPGGNGFLTNVIAVAAGVTHSLALKNDGTVWAWGRDSNGQLGDDTTPLQQPTPVQVTGLSGVIAVSTAGSHSLALKGDGTVWAWGADLSGALGNDAELADQPTPVQVAGLTNVVAVAGGAGHSLALKNDGAVWAWGSDFSGQLGNDTPEVNRPTPVLVAGLAGVIALAGGQTHSLLLKGDGTVWAWGNDSSGQVGNGGGLVQQPTPVQVVGTGGNGFLTNVTAIAAGSGSNHSLAVKSNGTVWAWGSNSNGQLGNVAALEQQPFPVQVTGLTDVLAVAAGSIHSLALKSDGTVWAWGSDFLGQLGNDAALQQQSTPAQVAGLTGVVAIAAGCNHSLALKGDGTAWAWGFDGLGQLGNDAALTDRPTPVQVSGITGNGVALEVVAIAAGCSHSLAIGADQTIWTWGSDSSGALGNDVTLMNQPSPVRPNIFQLYAIAGGGSHSLAAARDGSNNLNGPVWAWGYDHHFGQVGNDTALEDQPTPVQVSGLTGVVALAAGRDHSLALKGDGTVWVWGSDDNGQLGDDVTPIRQPVPKLLVNPNFPSSQ